MSGGYAPDVDAIVTIHTNTIREARPLMSVTFRLLTEADVKAVLSMDDLIETMASALQRFSSGARHAAGPHDHPGRRHDAFFGIMPAFVRGDSAAGDRDYRGGLRSARSWSPFSAQHTRAGCRRTSRRSCCSIRRPARCWRCSTAATSPRRGRRRCRRCRRGCWRARPRSRWRSSGRACRRGATSRRCRACTSLRQVTVWSPKKPHRDAFVAWAIELPVGRVWSRRSLPRLAPA